MQHQPLLFWGENSNILETQIFYLKNENDTFLMIFKYCGFDTMTT